MENTAEYIDELIGKYLAGEASENERKQLTIWEGQSVDNQKRLQHYKLIFERASAIKELYHFDQDAAWNKVKARLKQDAKVISLAHRTPSFNLYRIAASIIIVLGVTFFVYKALDKPVINAVEVVAETKSVDNVLPDGSNVFLNKQTKLSYGYDKRKKAHVIRLKGEAYFKIRHEEDKTLIVDLAGVYVRDIGTSFNVKAYPDRNTIEVVVEEGEVVFYTDNNPGLHLHATGKGVYNKTTKEFYVEAPEQNVMAYKTKVFSFEGTKLEDVVNDLNAVYEKKIVLPDHLKSCKLTVNFNNEDLNEVVSIMAETLSLTVKQTDKEILLEGPRCE